VSAVPAPGAQAISQGGALLRAQCAVERRPFPPGQHGQRRRKFSEYALQLREKQKARNIYGVLERQFRRHFEDAERLPGMTGHNLLRILESRLDNVVYRLGFADSRNQSRQIVRHGHFTLNGRRTDIPSARVKAGDVIAVHPTSRDNEYFQTVRETMTRKNVPGWLSVDPQNLAGRVMALPNREDIETQVNEALVVEYYSR